MTALAVGSVALVVLTLLARAQPVTNRFLLVLAVGSPYALVVALIAVVLSALTRGLFLPTVASAVLAITVAVQAPWYYGSRPIDDRPHVQIRVLASNLRRGQVDASHFVQRAAHCADVIAVSELTPTALVRLRAAGISETFPHSVLIPAPEAGGIGIWSRYALQAHPTQPLRNTTIVSSRLKIPGVQIDPLVSSVHVISPIGSDPSLVDDWRVGIGAIKSALADFSATVKMGAIIVAGDFNSTSDMRQFRDLLTVGYNDAVEQTGSGFSPTFPSNLPIKPLITIDHVLTRNAPASSIRTVDVAGSDHRALLATVEVPRTGVVFSK